MELWVGRKCRGFSGIKKLNGVSLRKTEVGSRKSEWGKKTAYGSRESECGARRRRTESYSGLEGYAVGRVRGGGSWPTSQNAVCGQLPGCLRSGRNRASLRSRSLDNLWPSHIRITAQPVPMDRCPLDCVVSYVTRASEVEGLGACPNRRPEPAR